MKRMLVTPALALVLVGLLAAGGCVPQGEYDEALSMNMKLKRQLEDCQSQLRGIEGERGTFGASLAECQARLDARSREVEVLNDQNRALQGSLEELTARYRELEARLGQAPPQFGALPTQVNAALQQLASEYPDLVEFDAQRGMLKLKSDLTFAKGSADLNPQATAAIQRFGQILATAEARAFNIYVAGHTDNIPVRQPRTVELYRDNWGLSAARAMSVVRTLGQAGVTPARIAGIGFGDNHPIAPNAPGQKGNEANRRVEIWIVPPSLFLTDTVAAASEAPTTPAVPVEMEK